MKFLGNSLHIANSGKLIARAKKTPNADGIVYDSHNNKIGKVNYVFGPTKNEYIYIRLFRSANINKIKKNYGEKLFVSKPKQKKSKRRGRRLRNKK